MSELRITSENGSVNVVRIVRAGDSTVLFDYFTVEGGVWSDIQPDDARAIRDALNEALGEKPLEGTKCTHKVGTVSVKVVPDTSEFGSELLRAIRLEVQRLAESAVDYAVKPAARQALANLAGAAELALAAVDDD